MEYSPIHVLVPVLVPVIREYSTMYDDLRVPVLIDGADSPIMYCIFTIIHPIHSHSVYREASDSDTPARDHLMVVFLENVLPKEESPIRLCRYDAMHAILV